MKKHIVVLSGAGMSAESGLRTFRDNDGLWEDHRVEEVAIPEAWETNRGLVLRFYNERRRALLDAAPNAGHTIIAEWQKTHRVSVVTQNVDDLHERAGSTGVIHLHGELRKARSTADPSRIYEIEGWELRDGDLCELGSQLRPHIVWFGEMVETMPDAFRVVSTADILVIVGTSLQVYPAAGLAWAAPAGTQRFLVDPNPPPAPGFQIIRAGASEGLAVIDRMLAEDPCAD